MGVLSKFIQAFRIEFGHLWWHLAHPASTRGGLLKKRTGQAGKRTPGGKRTRWVRCEQCRRNRMACTANCGRCFECCTKHGKAMIW